MHRFRRLTVLLLGLFLIGCAIVPMAPPELDTAAKQFPPVPPDQAMLYVVWQGFPGSIAFLIFLDGQAQGSLRYHTYLVIPTTPGVHQLVAYAAEVTAQEVVTLPAGKITVVELRAHTRFAEKPIALRVLSEAEGRSAIQDAQRAAGSPMPALTP
jgi:hypothetical protein